MEKMKAAYEKVRSAMNEFEACMGGDVDDTSRDQGEVVDGQEAYSKTDDAELMKKQALIAKMKQG